MGINVIKSQKEREKSAKIYLNVLVAAVLVFGATFYADNGAIAGGKIRRYIDPGCEFNGNGSSGECASASGGPGAYNTYTGIGWTAGEEYLQRSGTVHFGSVLVDGSGSPRQPIKIGAYDRGDAPVITSRKSIAERWEEDGGIFRIDVRESIVEVFWAWDGRGSWEDAVEVPEDTVNPEIPEQGKWGQAGTWIYYNPGESQPRPNSGQNSFYYSLNTSLTALVIEGNYVQVDNLRLTRSAHHGIKAKGSHNSVKNVLADHNGNTTSNTANGKGIGNGIELVGSYNSVTNSVAAYNEDHGFAIELIEGLPKPVEDSFVGSISHHNGDNGAIVQGGPDGMVHGTFSNCEFYGNGADNDYSSNGLRFIYGYGTVDGCKIHDNYGAGIELLINFAGSQTVISNNNIYDNNQAGNSYASYQDTGIAISRNYQGGVEITGNTIMNTGRRLQTSAIRQYYDGRTGKIVIQQNNILDHDVGIDLEANRDNIVADIGNNYYSPVTWFMFNYELYTLEEWNDLDFVTNDMTVSTGKPKKGRNSSLVHTDLMK